eukprot:1498081-Prymnesium_polylepis.1
MAAAEAAAVSASTDVAANRPGGRNGAFDSGLSADRGARSRCAARPTLTLLASIDPTARPTKRNVVATLLLDRRSR